MEILWIVENSTNALLGVFTTEEKATKFRESTLDFWGCSMRQVKVDPEKIDLSRVVPLSIVKGLVPEEDIKAEIDRRSADFEDILQGVKELGMTKAEMIDQIMGKAPLGPTPRASDKK